MGKIATKSRKPSFWARYWQRRKGTGLTKGQVPIGIVKRERVALGFSRKRRL